MRRLITVLAAGLLAPGTVLTAAAAASAGPTAIHKTTCTSAGNEYFSFSSNGVSYYLGTPSKASSGSAAILKPKQNSTTLWTLSACPKGDLLENRGLALTSRATRSGVNVTLEPPGNGGTGFASQQWFITCNDPPACSQWDFNNVKTVLWLRIRNSGPIMGQTVTTGGTPTNWSHSP
jgi:hypothetical protein